MTTADTSGGEKLLFTEGQAWVYSGRLFICFSLKTNLISECEDLFPGL
jgi:hypothetical protein